MGYGHQQGLRAAHDEKDVSKAGHKRATDCWNELLIGSYRTLQRAAGIAAGCPAGPLSRSAGEAAEMTPPADPERYKHHRFPSEIISHGVWLYYRFPLSYRDVQELLFERGVTVSHEAMRQWCRKFGQDDANRLRRRPQ